MRQMPLLRLPAVQALFSWSRVALLLVGASTLAIALIAGSSAGAANTVIAVVASTFASQPVTPLVAPLVVPIVASLAGGLADAERTIFTALMIASVGVTPFVVRDVIAHIADHARPTRGARPQQAPACQQISRRTLLIMGVAGCFAGGQVESGVAAALEALADQVLALQSTAL